jgi:hypothetical protein
MGITQRDIKVRTPATVRISQMIRSIAQVRSLLAASAQPAEDKKRDVALSAAHDAWDAQRTRAEAAERRVRELEERLQGLLTASKRYWDGDDEDGAEMLAEFERARAIIQRGSDACSPTLILSREAPIA